MLVRDWTRQNRSWFAAVQIEKRMMFIILGLIVAVAAFNLVSTLVMTVTEKQSDIAIMRTLGQARQRDVGLHGAGRADRNSGHAARGRERSVRCEQPRHYFPDDRAYRRFSAIPKDIYFISSLPSDPRASDIVPIALISMVLSLIATLYPSWRASASSPPRRCVMTEAVAAVLSARGVEKSYREGGLAVDVLRGADLDVAPGELVAVVGASGSGKSTLLHVFGGLDAADRGQVLIEGPRRRAVERSRSRPIA